MPSLRLKYPVLVLKKSLRGGAIVDFFKLFVIDGELRILPLNLPDGQALCKLLPAWRRTKLIRWRACLLAAGGRAGGGWFGTEAANGVREILSHDVMVGRHLFAVQVDSADDTMAFVKVCSGQDIALADFRSGDGKTVKREADDRRNRGVGDAAAQSVIVIFVASLRMATALVLNFPGASITAAGIESIEESNSSQHYTRLATHALR